MKNKKNKTIHIHPHHWDHERLKQLIHFFEGQKILVVGDVGLDRYIKGEVTRISPEAPVPIVAVESEELKLGLAANVADNVSALGGKPLLTGMIGKDWASNQFLNILKKLKITDRHLLTDPGRKTTLKERVVSGQQQLLRIDFENLHAMSAAHQKNILSLFEDALKQADIVIVEDYAKGLLSQNFLKKIVSKAKKQKKCILLDPNASTPLKYYVGVDLLTPNTSEAEKLSGIKITDETSLLKCAQVLIRTTRAQHVIITRGKEGMALFSRGSQKIKLIPTWSRDVYDVSGAGDTVIAVLALSLSVGATLEEAAILGNLAAGVEVGKIGTATVSVDEVLLAMDYFGSLTV